MRRFFLLLLTVLWWSVNAGEESCQNDGQCISNDIIAVEDDTLPQQQLEDPIQQNVEDEDVHSDCRDEHERCAMWASQGECRANPSYMLESCRLSCAMCSNKRWTDEDLRFGRDFGVDQHQMESPAFSLAMKTTRQYMEKMRQEYYGMDDLCSNQHEKCTEWAVAGECQANPKYMSFHCGPVCQTCHVHTYEHKCPMDPNAPVAWKAGDLQDMFVRLTSESIQSQYSVQVLSSDPWVIVMDDLLSDQEAQHLITQGHARGYKRSSDVGQRKPDGTYQDDINAGRTSDNTWCQDDCYDNNPTTMQIVTRISEVTGIPETNSEWLQLLRYQPGQFYQTHHDYVSNSDKEQAGPRILTVYLYLNDVQEGGGTNFDQLNITVAPKRGRALLWPSVLNDDPMRKDGRTTHQALPVIQGIKYGANAWFHLRDFKNPSRNNC